MSDGLFSWNASNHTSDENVRFVRLRAVEWDSYPNFLSPLWGVFVVYFYGWVPFIISLIIITFIWKIFIMNSFLSTGLLSGMATIVNSLKWPLAVIMAIVAYCSHSGLLVSLSLLLFPFITYFLNFLELPYFRVGGFKKQAEHMEQIQKRISHQLGI